MKRTTLWISLILMLLLASLLLASCTLPSSLPIGQDGGLANTPTLSDVEMQTQIALLLTAMPTSTPQVQAPSATVSLPTLTPETPSATNTEVVQPTQQLTETPITLPTETSAPQAEVTATPQPTQAATATVAATSPTFTPPANDPRVRFGAPTSVDTMENDRTWIWPTGSDKYTSGNFSNGSMTVTALGDLDGWRMANPVGHSFSSLYLEGTFHTTTCKGSDHYGLIVRVPDIHSPNQGYLYSFTCDGRYSLRRWDGEAGTKGEMKWLVNWTASPAIATGSNATNRLGILTIADRLVLYANGQMLTEIKDNSFSSGYFGVLVGADETKELTVLVDEMAYWENPLP